MHIKLISLNMWDGGRLFPEIKAFLAQEQPDLLFLQEVNSATAPHLEERFRTMEVVKSLFPEYHSYFGKVFGDLRPEEGLIVEGNALFSRWQLRNCANTFIDIPYADIEHWKWTEFTKQPEAMVSAEITVDGQEIFLLNVHGPWELSERDNERRLNMRDKILALIQNKKNVVMAGDFNVKPNTQTIKGIEEKLHNVFKDELTTTFNVQHKTHPGYATAVVDMLFTSSNIKIIRKECVDINVSDHLPLVVEFELA